MELLSPRLRICRNLLFQADLRMEHIPEEVMQRVLEETYIGSLDCPKIHGIRSIEDIIKGHRAQGEYDAALWTVAMRGQEPVGVLFLSPSPSAQCMELTYLGITPLTRGKPSCNELLNSLLRMDFQESFSLSTLIILMHLSCIHVGNFMRRTSDIR